MAADYTVAEMKVNFDRLNAKRAADGKAALVVQPDGLHVDLGNGALGTYVKRNKKDGTPFAKFSIVEGAPDAYLNRIHTPKGQRQMGKPLSREKAVDAFNRYYRRRDYKSPGDRQAAITRDMNYSPSRKGVRDPSRIWDTTRYLRNPGPLDYPGVDAGPQLSKSKGNTGALAAWRAQNPKGSATLKHYKKSAAHPDGTRRSKRQVLTEIKRRSKTKNQAGGSPNGSEDEECVSQSTSESESVSSSEVTVDQQPAEEASQSGGRAVSLKTAVRLLRNYYSNRYQK